MNLLAIETTGAAASAALMEMEEQANGGQSGNGRLTVQRSAETMNHLQHLIPMISELLSKCKKQIDDVDAIAISQGPGSFTGIRIGMATARMLAQVRGIPLVGVPTLKTFAYQEEPVSGLICPIFDARRSQVYAGVYLREMDGSCRCLLEDGAYDIPDYLEGLKKAAAEAATISATLFGDGVSPYGETIIESVKSWNFNIDRISTKDDPILKNAMSDNRTPENNIPAINLQIAEECVRFQDAGAVARLGAELYQRGEGKSFSEVHPVYLRMAEAERKLAEKRAAEKHMGGERV